MNTNVIKIKTSQEVTLPGWCGEAFNCELRRPSLLTLASRGAIANSLMQTARKIFYAGIKANENSKFDEEAKVLIEIAKASLVNPTFAELEENGIELTDEQLIAIFQYSQLGAKALEQFRKLPANSNDSDDGAEVSDKTK